MFRHLENYTCVMRNHIADIMHGMLSKKQKNKENTKIKNLKQI